MTDDVNERSVASAGSVEPVAWAVECDGVIFTLAVTREQAEATAERLKYRHEAIRIVPVCDVSMQAWIPVSAMLPGDGVKVLVFTDDGGVEIAVRFVGEWRVVWSWPRVATATHWMPLPAPPAE